MNNPNHQLFTLNTLIAASLIEIGRLKSLTVQTEQYELTAQLREMQQICQSIESDIACGIYPAVADRVTETGNTNYFDLLFKYGYLQKWKNISGNFDVALALRKKLLNDNFVPGEEEKEKLNSLNKTMAKLEARVGDFYDGLKQKAGDGLIDEGESALVVIKCYSFEKAYSFLSLSPDKQKPFYEFSISHSQWKKDPDQLKEKGLDDHQKGKGYQSFMQALELKNYASLTFSLLAMQGYLAWEDFVNIDNIELEVKVGCKFT